MPVQNNSHSRYYLAVVSGTDCGCCVELRTQTLLGRQYETPQLKDPFLSRAHGIIRLGRGYSTIETLPGKSPAQATGFLHRKKISKHKNSTIVDLRKNPKFTLGNNVYEMRMRPRSLQIHTLRLPHWQTILPVITAIFAVTSIAQLWVASFLPILLICGIVVGISLWLAAASPIDPCKLILIAATNTITPTDPVRNTRIRVGPGRTVPITPGNVICFEGRAAWAQTRLAAAQLALAKGYCLESCTFENAPDDDGKRGCVHVDDDTVRSPNCVCLMSEFSSKATLTVKRFWWPYLQLPSVSWWEQLKKILTRDDLPRAIPIVHPLPMDKLRAHVGQTTAGSAVVDFALDPHLLIAGTTGSGKSVALTTLLLSLAASSPPSELQMILIDYKGGDAFGPLARLPHVLTVLHNLAPAETERALDSLDYELERRQRENRRIPLFIVVDEFHELTQYHSHLVSRLQRVCVLGRGLGVHLIAATQRPRGCMTADMLANISGRLILRLLDLTDFHELLGSRSKTIIPNIPGRGLIKTRGHIQPIQVAQILDTKQAIADIVTAYQGFIPPPDALPWIPALPSFLPHRAGEWFIADSARTRSQFTISPPSHLAIFGGAGSGVSWAVHAAATASSQLNAPCLSISCTNWKDSLHPKSRAAVAALVTAPPDSVLAIDDADKLIQAIDEREGPGQGMRLIEDVISRVKNVIIGSHSANNLIGLCPATLTLAISDPVALLRLNMTPDSQIWADRPGRGTLKVHSIAHHGQIYAPNSNNPLPVVGTTWAHDLDNLHYAEGIIGWYGAKACALKFSNPSPITIVASTASIAAAIAKTIQQRASQNGVVKHISADGTKHSLNPVSVFDFHPTNPVHTESMNLAQPITLFIGGQIPGLAIEIRRFCGRKAHSETVALIDGEIMPFNFSQAHENTNF